MPKELAIGMATESSELLQLFRFMSDEHIAGMLEDTEQRQAIEDELPTRSSFSCVFPI